MEDVFKSLGTSGEKSPRICTKCVLLLLLNRPTTLSLATNEEREGIEQTERGVEALAAGLGHVADASFVMHGRGDKVAAFLQAREDGEDELSEGGVGGTLEKVKERSEAALKGCRQNEGEQSLSHSMLKQSLENEIKGMKKLNVATNELMMYSNHLTRLGRNPRDNVPNVYYYCY